MVARSLIVYASHADAAFVIEHPLASAVPRRFGQSGSREALHIGMSVLQRCAKAMDRGKRLLL